MRVKSKIDLWVGLVIWSVIVIMGASMTKLNDQTAISYAIGLPVIALLLWIYFGTYYELRDEYLYCRSGPFTEKIAYPKIKSVKLSRNMLSSMALSGDRIEIKQHGKGYLLGTTFISPENREQFMSEMINRCKNLKYHKLVVVTGMSGSGIFRLVFAALVGCVYFSSSFHCAGHG